MTGQLGGAGQGGRGPGVMVAGVGGLLTENGRGRGRESEGQGRGQKNLNLGRGYPKKIRKNGAGDREEKIKRGRLGQLSADNRLTRLTKVNNQSAHCVEAHYISLPGMEHMAAG